MSTNEVGKGEARAALDAVKEKVSEKIAPKLARLRAVKGSARELREEVGDLNETVEVLAGQVAEVKRAVRAARERRGGGDGAES